CAFLRNLFAARPSAEGPVLALSDVLERPAPMSALGVPSGLVLLTLSFVGHDPERSSAAEQKCKATRTLCLLQPAAGTATNERPGRTARRPASEIHQEEFTLRSPKVGSACIPGNRSDTDQLLRALEEGRELRTGGLEDNLLNAIRGRPAHDIRQHLGT